MPPLLDPELPGARPLVGSRNGEGMAPAAPAVFLDRDGVINQVVFRDGRPNSPRSLDEFRLHEDAADAICRLRSAGFRTFVVSNQPDVARGLLTPDCLSAMGALLQAIIPVDAIENCPHDDGDGCYCRKPEPGMILSVAARWKIDLERSYVVGDTWKDVAAGRAAGCRTVLLRRAYNQGTQADHEVRDLGEAARLIIQRAGLA